jgi:hypothetical protein
MMGWDLCPVHHARLFTTLFCGFGFHLMGSGGVGGVLVFDMAYWVLLLLVFGLF